MGNFCSKFCKEYKVIDEIIDINEKQFTKNLFNLLKHPQWKGFLTLL